MISVTFLNNLEFELNVLFFKKKADRMIDRENYIQIQTIFKKALIYELELNGKDITFFNQLKEVNLIT